MHPPFLLRWAWRENMNAPVSGDTGNIHDTLLSRMGLEVVHSHRVVLWVPAVSENAVNVNYFLLRCDWRAFANIPSLRWDWGPQKVSPVWNETERHLKRLEDVHEYLPSLWIPQSQALCQFCHCIYSNLISGWCKTGGSYKCSKSKMKLWTFTTTPNLCKFVQSTFYLGPCFCFVNLTFTLHPN